MSTVTELLQQIATNTARDDSVWIAVVSGAAAVLGAAVAAGFGYLVARRTAQSQERIERARLKATVVTTERLRWLQDIRQRLAAFYTRTDMQYNLLKRPYKLEQYPELQKAFDEESRAVAELCHVMILMLNPSKPDQAKLQAALNGTLNFLLQCHAHRKDTGSQTFDDGQYTKIKRDAFLALTEIGVTAWDKIQSLE